MRTSARCARCNIWIEGLIGTLEARDPVTKGHSARVAYLAAATAMAMGLPDAQREIVLMAGLLHDVGKIGIRDSILNKLGTLTDEEWAEMHRHPQMSLALVCQAMPSAEAELLDAIRQHHERLDGSGYPDGIAGDAISLPARILAVADTFDAVTSNRPYHRAHNRESAIEILQAGAGVHFDGQIVAAFVAAQPDITPLVDVGILRSLLLAGRG